MTGSDFTKLLLKFVLCLGVVYGALFTLLVFWAETHP